MSLQVAPSFYGIILPVLPLIIPLAALGLAVLAWCRSRIQQVAGIGAAMALVVVAVALFRTVASRGDLLVRLGGWPAPVGIPLGVDPLTAMMLGLTGLMGFLTQVYAWGNAPSASHQRPFVPLFMIVLLGVNGAFLARDLFNLYVWFEVMLMGGFGLLVVTGGRLGREAAVKSVTLNLLGSLLFLVAVGVTYGLAGSLDMYVLQDSLARIHAERPSAVLAIAALLVSAFAVKAALFPFHFWLPASYHVPAAGVCALFAAMLTKVGVYSILRLLTLPFAVVEGLAEVLGILAAITMVGGVIGAVAQTEMKRILAWHSISQVGYMVAGLALLSAPDPRVRLAGVAAAIFFIIHHGLVKPALFLVAGLVQDRLGDTRLARTGGLFNTAPVLATVFLLAALSLAGLPPFSGFWAKLAVIQSVMEAGAGWLVAAALAAGLVTLLSMLKIWNEVFWKPAPEHVNERKSTSGRAALVATIALVAVITVIGLMPTPLLEWSQEAAAGVLEDQARIFEVGR